MIEPIEGLPSNVIGIEADGKVSREDYEQVLDPLVEQALAEHDKVRCLYVLGPDFERYTLGAAWQDAKVGVEHWKHWERIACVSDAGWVTHGIHAFGWMVPGAIRVFPTDQLQVAVAWVSTE